MSNFPVPAFSAYPWKDEPSTATPVDSQHLQAAENGLAAYVAQVAQLLGLGPVAPVTTTYNANAGDFVPVDATSSSIAVALPARPGDGSRVGVKLIAVAGGHSVSVNCSGADVFNVTGGSTSYSIVSLFQGVLLQYCLSLGVWYVIADDVPASAVPSLSSTGPQTFSGEVRAPDFYAVGLTGATSQTRYVGGTVSGAPVSGAFSKGDWVVAQNGNVWVCTTAGSPGTWANAGVAGTTGVTSWNTRTAAVVPASGDYTAAQVTNAADKSSGSAQAFTGNVSAPALIASGLTGATAASRYVGATAAGAPVSGTFALGDFVVDQTGAVWVCSVAGSPGTWSSLTAGAGSPWQTVEGPVSGGYKAAQSGTFVFGCTTATTLAVAQLGANNFSGQGAFWFDPADFTVAGRTTNVRVRGWVITTSPAPAANYTFALSPVNSWIASTTTNGGDDIATVGTATCSTTISTPAINTQTHSESGAVAAPTAGWYCLTVTANASTAAPAWLGVRLQLERV